MSTANTYNTYNDIPYVNCYVLYKHVLLRFEELFALKNSEEYNNSSLRSELAGADCICRGV